MNKLPLMFITAISLSLSGAQAKTPAERYAEEMAKYSKTNTFENCIRNNAIKRTKILDSQNIIFEMRNKKVFLNTLPRKCHQLARTRQYAVNVRNNRLCSVDVITVMDAMIGPRGACGLGKFELLEKKAEIDS